MLLLRGFGFLFAFLVSVGVFAVRCDAAITSATVTGSGSVPLVSSDYGVLQTALNFGGETTTNNSIAFFGTTVSGDPQSATVASSPFSVSISTPSANGLRIDDTIAPDPLFGSEIWSTNQLSISLTVSGLDPTLGYQFQFLHGDTRGQVYSNGTIVFTDSLGTSVNRQLTFGNSGNTYAIVTVEVSGTTSLTYDMPPASRGPSYSGMTVIAIPEPAASVAILMGIAGLFQACRLGSRRGSFSRVVDRR